MKDILLLILISVLAFVLFGLVHDCNQDRKIKNEVETWKNIHRKDK
jgi:hypothetical protein